MLGQRRIENGIREQVMGKGPVRRSGCESAMPKKPNLVRKVDELGRVIVPSEFRRALAIRPGDELEISVSGESVVLEKRLELCCFCSSEPPALAFRGKNLCHYCLSGLRGQLPEIEVCVPESETAGA